MFKFCSTGYSDRLKSDVMRPYVTERTAFRKCENVCSIPLEFQNRSKTRFVWNQLQQAVKGLDFVQLSEDSDTLLVFAPTISEFVITMMKLKAVLMTRDLDDYVSIGQF